LNPAFIKAIDDLASEGWHSSFNFFPQELIQELRHVLLKLQEQEAFTPAKIGKGKNKKRIPEIRGDYIRWLSQSGDFPATVAYLNYIDEFKKVLNRELFIGVHEYEAHFAIYPAGTFYKKHLDRHKQNPHRLLTTTLYLNQDYHLEQGGILVLENLKNEVIAHIAPEWGRFVCFLSADFPHQVMPTTVARYSLTGWLRSQS
jgi:SM-20-related protein